MKITRSQLKKIIIESLAPSYYLLKEQSDIPCKRDVYWGRGGAGVMFICSEDDTILLLLRAEWVDNGETWGIPGGGVEEGWFDTPIEEPITDQSIFIDAALREAEEECGSLPPGFSEDQLIRNTIYEDCGFQYKTYIADITLEQKNSWELVSNDEETDQFEWFPKSAVFPGAELMGYPLHFGVEYTISNM